MANMDMATCVSQRRGGFHEAVANHFSLAVNEDGTKFLMNPNQRRFNGSRTSRPPRRCQPDTVIFA